MVFDGLYIPGERGWVHYGCASTLLHVFYEPSLVGGYSGLKFLFCIWRIRYLCPSLSSFSVRKNARYVLSRSLILGVAVLWSARSRLEIKLCSLAISYYWCCSVVNREVKAGEHVVFSRDILLLVLQCYEPRGQGWRVVEGRRQRRCWGFSRVGPCVVSIISEGPYNAVARLCLCVY